MEREGRIKAEEFAAAMAARAKAGFEDRNEEIVGLGMKVSSLESEKENFDHQRQLTLRAVHLCIILPIFYWHSRNEMRLLKKPKDTSLLRSHDE